MVRLAIVTLSVLVGFVASAQNYRPLPQPRYGAQPTIQQQSQTQQSRNFSGPRPLPFPTHPQQTNDPSQQPPTQTPAEKIGQGLCQQVFSGRVFRYDFVFDPQFRLLNPELVFRDQVREVIEAAGVCQSWQLLPKLSANDPANRVLLMSSLGQQTTLQFTYGPNGLITSFSVVDMVFPKVVIRSWAEVSGQLARLPGVATMTAGSYSIGLMNLRPSVTVPVGNAASLYVLKAVEEAIYAGTAHWTDLSPIRDEWKSFPSGEMQTWPAGRMVSTALFAENMIRINDNTAMDHLIHMLGRSAVQDALSKGGQQTTTLPFLRTDELFKLKWGAPAEWLPKYAKMSSDERAAFLEGDLKTIPLTSVGHNGLSMFQPTYIRQAEWFATTTDLCKVMQSFLVRHDPVIMKLMSLNTPFIDAGPGKPALYAAYKEGSEPGVLSMTYLILDRRNQWGCVSAAWSNEQHTVNTWVLRDIMRKSLKVYDPDL